MAFIGRIYRGISRALTIAAIGIGILALTQIANAYVPWHRVFNGFGSMHFLTETALRLSLTEIIVHGVLLMGLFFLGWFKVLRVGNAVSVLGKAIVYAGTAVGYVAATSLLMSAVGIA